MAPQGSVEEPASMEVEAPFDPVKAEIEALPEFEIKESDSTLLIYPIPPTVELVHLHKVIGRFGELIDFDGA
eukprot:1383238-Lingulodinium_polyedra.AAC.1